VSTRKGVALPARGGVRAAMRHAALLAVLLCSCCSVVHAQFEEFFSQRGGRRGPAAGAGGGAPDTEYYDALGLSPGCSEDEIKKAYRKRALREHPDKGGDPEKFKQLNEAYGVLSDGQKRAAYDQMGKAGVDGSGGGGGGMDGFPGGFGGGSFGGISPEDLFAQFFGGGVPQQRARPRMRDQRMTLPVSLEEMYSGATRRIAVPRPYLGADGRVREERVEVDLQLQPGAADGQRFRIRASKPNQANVEVILRQKAHARFERRGDDLVCRQEISLLDALTGFRTGFRHLDGRVLSLACDAEVTQPGQLRRIRGCGMPRPRGTGKGDLFLRMSVRFPRDPLAAEASRQLKQLLPRAANAGAARAPPPTPGERVYAMESVREEQEEAGAEAEFAF